MGWMLQECTRASRGEEAGLGLIQLSALLARRESSLFRTSDTPRKCPCNPPPPAPSLRTRQNTTPSCIRQTASSDSVWKRTCRFPTRAGETHEGKKQKGPLGGGREERPRCGELASARHGAALVSPPPPPCQHSARPPRPPPLRSAAGRPSARLRVSSSQHSQALPACSTAWRYSVEKGAGLLRGAARESEEAREGARGRERERETGGGGGGGEKEGHRDLLDAKGRGGEELVCGSERGEDMSG
eukprot:3338346-Rhodomonas_salina.1